MVIIINVTVETNIDHEDANVFPWLTNLISHINDERHHYCAFDKVKHYVLNEVL